jgi:hypothetical protein
LCVSIFYILFGVFAKQYAAGWVGSDIDLIERSLSCGCKGDQFILILDAYNNKTMGLAIFKMVEYLI